MQQFGEAHGIPVQIIRANPEEHPADEAEVLERVTEWRKHILNGLGITEPPLWNEDANQTPLLYRQAGLGWYHCFAAVCVVNQFRKRFPKMQILQNFRSIRHVKHI